MVEIDQATPVSVDESAPKAKSRRAKPSKSELKRERIIAAAATIFRRRGYAQATLGEIAAEAGTQAGSLYYYFEGRDELVEAVLRYSSERLKKRVEAALEQLPPGADALDRFVTMIRTHAFTVLDRDEFSMAYQKVHDQVSDEMRERIAVAPRAYARVWAGVLKDAVKAGFVRPGLDQRLIRLLVVGSISWMADWYKPDGPATAEEVVEMILQVFLVGVGKDREYVVNRIQSPPPASPRATAKRRGATGARRRRRSGS